MRTKGANKIRLLGGKGPRARIEQYRSEETEQETDPAKYLPESQAAARWGFQFELSRRFLQLPQTLPGATCCLMNGAQTTLCKLNRWQSHERPDRPTTYTLLASAPRIIQRSTALMQRRNAGVGTRAGKGLRG